ncbi:MAG TPA: discoidin domain-containing protein, partial [Armatimonadota bacterium]|nr:discoidin domain-containing protein [Armatimonadota bacterium]
EGAARVSIVLVATQRGEGDSTVWFDDPRVVQVAEGGQETVLLPLERELPPASAAQTKAWLTERQKKVMELLVAARGGGEAARLAQAMLAQAREAGERASDLKRESEKYANVSAALETCAWRLERAARLLVGWRMELSGRPRVAQGEPAEFEVQLGGASVPVTGLEVSVEAPPGWRSEIVGRPPAALAPGQAATATVRLTGGGEGGTVQVVSTGRIEGDHEITVMRSAAFEVVPALSTSLTAGGQAEGGRVQQMMLVATNARLRAPVSITVRVTPPQGFSAEPAERTLEIGPEATEQAPITLTAGPDLVPGWQVAEVAVKWDGGEATHRLPFIYLPETSNLLSNPGMEDGDAERATGWSGYSTGGYAVDGEVKHSGARAIRAVNQGEQVMAGAVQTLTLNQTEARPLVIRGWSLHQGPGGDNQELQTIGTTEQAGPTEGERSNNYAVYVDLHYVGGGALYGQTATFDKSARGWQFSQSVIHVARPVADATVYLLFRNQEGTAWFDDVFVGELGPNLAVEEGARAETDSSYSSYTPAPLNDGVVRVEGVPWDQAAWASADVAGEHWAQIDLPGPRQVRSVVIYWSLDNGVWTSRDYRVQAEVGGQWQDVAAARGMAPEPMSVHYFEPVTTERVRVLQADHGGPAERPGIMWIREIELY